MGSHSVRSDFPDTPSRRLLSEAVINCTYRIYTPGSTLTRPRRSLLRNPSECRLEQVVKLCRGPFESADSTRSMRTGEECRVAIPSMTRSCCAIWTLSMSRRGESLGHYRRVDYLSCQSIRPRRRVPHNPTPKSDALWCWLRIAVTRSQYRIRIPGSTPMRSRRTPLRNISGRCLEQVVKLCRGPPS